MPTIIIDDQDLNVTHGGSWEREGVQQEYQMTTSSSSATGSFLQLQFYGSEITAYGTVGQIGDTTVMTFQVDSGETQMYTAEKFLPIPQFHTNLFSESSLSPDIPHTLLITQANSPNTSNLFIDYFLVTVPDTANSTGSSDLLRETLFVDDASAQVSYSGNWNSDAGTNQDLQGTLHAAGASGATATLTFDGMSITIYGDIPQGASGDIVTFTLDDNFKLPSSYLVPTDPAPSFYLNVSANTQMFSVGGLAAGNHTLLMTALSSEFYFDYAVVTGFTSSPAVVSANATTTTVATTFASTSTTGKITPFVRADGGTPLAVIVGPVVGGVVAIILLVLSVVLLLRRRRRRTANGEQQTATEGAVTPFTYQNNAESAMLAQPQPGRLSEKRRLLASPLVHTSSTSQSHTPSSLRASVGAELGSSVSGARAKDSHTSSDRVALRRGKAG